MIYTVFQGMKEELYMIEKEVREQTALLTDEQFQVRYLYSRETLQEFLVKDHTVDMIFADITVFCGIDQVEELRRHYAKAAIILIADRTISPVSYMKPTILAAGLILKPLKKLPVQQTVQDVFRSYILKSEENVMVIETREEKYRIPYSKILYFEARCKKIYACTKDYEYGFYETLEHLEKECPQQFVRCHRSFMVNSQLIEQVKVSKNYLTVRGGIEIPLSRTYKNQIREIF